MKLEVGKTYVDGEGDTQRVVADDPETNSTYRFITVDADGYPDRFDENGINCDTEFISANYNLVKEHKELKRGTAWMNVYGDTIGRAHVSREGADKSAQPDRIARIKVHWTEGQFDV